MNQSVESQIRAFITDAFLFGDATRTVSDDESLIEAGLVDSTGILELVAYVEETFDVLVSDADIVPDNFDSVARISAYVSSRHALSAVA